MPVVDALKGFFAGQEDVGHRESDIHHTLTLAHTLSLEFLHFLWICWDYHLSGGGEKERQVVTVKQAKTRHRKMTRGRQDWTQKNNKRSK